MNCIIYLKYCHIWSDFHCDVFKIGRKHFYTSHFYRLIEINWKNLK